MEEETGASDDAEEGTWALEVEEERVGATVVDTMMLVVGMPK